ncbi:MAG: carboxypeptidase-like regulatory domain-containing protein, partial [Marinirhabdus sp.]|nr:carboxypeptidase-like regulatory domain-containing protein [Marinirhabdus sp.]
MKTTILTLVCSIFCISGILFAQNATVKGVILDENNVPIPAVNVTAGPSLGTQSNFDGYYILEVPSGQEITITFSHVSHKNAVITIPSLAANEDFELNPVLKVDVEQIAQVVISANQRKRVQGLTTISPEAIRKIPGANAGVENLLKSLPGVISNNELSTQYAVRGGNYDENLVYVNEIEVYRPFLIRSGQQEGLSFVNSDLTR